ncbi:MAG: UDP-N-acetylenolpyruvoylglucosamine reductase, partial [Azoarcus sp.]|nr:UDP-N-acetylenolpyruvoylglucosamine reductase [Azoarcus sp.]
MTAFLPEQRDADLTALNTFGLPARARRLLRLKSADDARKAWAIAAACRAEKGLCLALGGGSNLVLRGEPLACVLKVEIAGRRKLGEDGEAVVVEAGAGENWHDFV